MGEIPWTHKTRRIKEKEIRSRIESTITSLKKNSITGHTGSGDPLRRKSLVINNHLVSVMLIGWDDRVEINLDKSTEPLTIDQAIERLLPNG